MTAPNTHPMEGHAGELVVHEWPNPDAHWIAVLVHGYGEHLGRYGAVAETLHAAGATVVGADHIGHGRSPGERVLITDFEPVVEDVRRVLTQAVDDQPGLPVVLIGHSMGGMIAARYGQRFADDLAALVLSGPVLGNWAALDLLQHPEIPDQPIDPATLSRDPLVGADYAADPLVWHGPFQRRTLEALEAMLNTINFDHPFDDRLPVLWLHGAEDALVPVAETRAGMDRLRGLNCEEILYEGARHEIFNETNADEVLTDVTAFVGRVLG